MVKAIEMLLNEVRLTFHAAVQVGDSLHQAEPITMAQRAVLEFLQRNGTATVPDIARARFVTRQHIQALVNGLLEAELVELRDNPAHKRSSLVALTRPGERTIARTRKREATALRRLRLSSTASDLRRAAKTLQGVRDALLSR